VCAQQRIDKVRRRGARGWQQLEDKGRKRGHQAYRALGRHLS
jgi:hypothetical protein